MTTIPKRTETKNL